MPLDLTTLLHRMQPAAPPLCGKPGLQLTPTTPRTHRTLRIPQCRKARQALMYSMGECSLSPCTMAADPGMLPPQLLWTRWRTIWWLERPLRKLLRTHNLGVWCWRPPCYQPSEPCLAISRAVLAELMLTPSVLDGRQASSSEFPASVACHRTSRSGLTAVT